jgi:hypothetical protein
MKQVWQTEDGSVFNTKEEAKKWEAQRKLVDDLMADLDRNTGARDIEEVAEYIVNHYNVTPK